jgi:predicted kinase
LKPLLNKGANMTMAADGFRDAQQFAAVAHAARNTEVPFVLLKHRVLDQGKTLAAAISESKPDINADVEATRAQAEARSDLARLAG